MSEEAKQEVQMPDVSRLLVSAGPHISTKETVPKFMFTVVIAMLPACLAGVWFFGLPALMTLIFCTGFCVLVEELWNKAVKRAPTWKDGSAILTGILLGMNLNAGTAWWVCLIGAILAIILAKQLFGGLGYNPFNPALVARVGLLIGFPGIMTTWSPLRDAGADAVTMATPLAAQTGSVGIVDLLMGHVGGCLGETSAIALLIGGIILMAFKLIKWQLPLAYIGTVVVITSIPFILDHHFGVSILKEGKQIYSPLYHVLSGGLLLGAFFMATDMVTSPMTKPGALVFGIGCGVVTSLIRLWGSYPEGVSFSILFMNALTPLIDRMTLKKPFGYVAPLNGEIR